MSTLYWITVFSNIHDLSFCILIVLVLIIVSLSIFGFVSRAYDYQEIKLPKQWRDGDILFSETDNEFAVFEVNHIHYPDKFFSHLSTCHAGYLTNQLMHKRDFRLATESEIEQFHNRLHAVNKDWDTEKKRLINWEWRPIINEAYYTLEIDRGDVEVRIRVYFNDDIDKKLIKNCNFFRTIKEAEEAVERIKKALKGE